MLKFIIKRALGLIPLLILVSMFSLIIQAAPGDPLDNYMLPGMTEEDVQAMREKYGLDGNIIEQGTHDSLLKADGFYASLYNSQFQE